MAHAKPFRLRVMEKLTALIETVQQDSNSDGDTGPATESLSGKVFRGRNLFGDTDPMPMIAILETPIALDQIPSPKESPKSTGFWDISIQGFVKDDKKNPTDPAYYLAADVICVLAKEKQRITTGRASSGRAPALLDMYAPNGKPAILDLQIGSPVCRPPDDISGKAYFWLAITLQLAENLEDPYA